MPTAINRTFMGTVSSAVFALKEMHWTAHYPSPLSKDKPWSSLSFPRVWNSVLSTQLRPETKKGPRWPGIANGKRTKKNKRGLPDSGYTHLGQTELSSVASVPEKRRRQSWPGWRELKAMKVLKTKKKKVDEWKKRRLQEPQLETSLRGNISTGVGEKWGQIGQFSLVRLQKVRSQSFTIAGRTAGTSFFCNYSPLFLVPEFRWVHFCFGSSGHLLLCCSKLPRYLSFLWFNYC